MQLVRTKNNKPVFPMFNVMDDIFDDFFKASPLEWKSYSGPALNILDNDSSYSVELTVPGYKEDELNIEMDGNSLIVSGERSVNSERKGKYYHYEKYHSKFSRSVSLPKNVDAENIEASLSHGVLSLTIPKREIQKSKKKIPIKLLE